MLEGAVLQPALTRLVALRAGTRMACQQLGQCVLADEVDARAPRPHAQALADRRAARRLQLALALALYLDLDLA